jgi:serine/threonine-protein kinase
MKRRGSSTGSPLVPERIGRYEVLLPIASGGMGTVYLARSRGVGGFQREVALKVMHAHLREEEHFATDLIEEAKLAVRIQHPNVVQVLDVGEDPHGVFLVMEYIEGESLAGMQRAAKRREETVPVRIGIRVLVDALLGLHAAHELRDDDGELLGLVHRDFSPHNILVGVDGISKLTDFGVAKARTRLSHTATGLVKGKIHYMSPEQARTDPIDRRCDVWAGGVMAWEMVAGRRMYTERTDAAILLRLVTEPPPRLRTIQRDVPQAIEDVVHHALATDMSARCPSAKALAEQLLSATESLGGAASADEVAEYVRATSGGNLQKRREQVTEVVKLRKEIHSIARESTVDSHDLTTSPADGAGSTDDGDELATTLPLDDAPQAQQEDEQTQVTHSSPAVVRTPSRIPQIVGVLAGVAVIGTLAYVFTRPPSAASSPPVASVEPSAPPAPSTSDTQEAVASSLATTASTRAPAASVPLSLTANAAIARVDIGERTIAVTPPKAKLEVTLSTAERQEATEVLAHAADGRIAKATLPRDATSLTIRFPVRAVRPVRPQPTAAPLATNPHQ